MTELDFLYAVHVSFIRLKGKLVPWHITMISTDPPFEIIRIGLSTKNLKWDHDDIKYNMEMNDDFPRLDSLKLNFEIELEDFDYNFRNIYMENFWVDSWVNVIGAVDRSTYEYLINVVNSVILLNDKLLGEEKTFAAAYKQHFLKNK